MKGVVLTAKKERVMPNINTTTNKGINPKPNKKGKIELLNANKNNQVNGESLVEELRTELQEIDAMEVGDHAERFEALHQRLHQALSSIDGL